MLTLEDFSAHIQTNFKVYYGDGGDYFTIELLEVKPLPQHDESENARAPFSLLFCSDDPNHYLPQGTHHLSHEQMGELHLFLVPLGHNPERTGIHYEAVFT